MRVDGKNYNFATEGARKVAKTRNKEQETNEQTFSQEGPVLRSNEGNRLLEFFMPLVEPVKGTDNQHYISFIDTPHIVESHDGPTSSAMNRICNLYFMKERKWPGSAAKAMASDYLSAQCSTSPAREVAMRAQYLGDAIYLDTAWESNEVIKIDSNGYSVLPSCEARFVRNGVTAPLPTPVRDGSGLVELLKYVRVEQDGLPALIATLINTMMTHLPQPLVLIQGPAAAGKTTSLRFLLDLIDPSTKMPGGSLTSNERDVRALSRVRRCLVFDNVSYVKGDVSDLLAKITTGAEMIARALFENSTPDVMQICRPVFINGILNGFTRSDLASRSIAFQLEPIPSSQRQSSALLLESWGAELPFLFHSLLEMTSQVLQELPNTPRHNVEFRNPDLVKMTQIIGSKLGIDGMDYLENSVDVLSEAVLGATDMGEAFTELNECLKDSTNGHCASNTKENYLTKHYRIPELREILMMHLPQDAKKEIPSTPKYFGEAVQRIESDLQNVLGLTINKKRVSSGVVYGLRRP
jgi:hypothetical protein